MDVLARLFAERGLSSEQIKNYLSWNLKELPPLNRMRDIGKAAGRIIQAMENSEQVAIYGDYDVDGTVSCALFFHFFNMLEKKTVQLMQPSRFKEGYGLHTSSIDEALELGVGLLITVDCGIANHEASQYALDKNLDLIITDHHKELELGLPPAYAVVNPNRRDEPFDSPLRDLAGVGVAFALCWEIREQLLKKNLPCPSLYPLLPFVAIGTICDLVKLNDMNKKLVRHGLKQIGNTNYWGIKTFFSKEEINLGSALTESISFKVGPLINSKGRLAHPEKALQLLISDHEYQALQYYRHLEECNRERKNIQARVFNDAKRQAEILIQHDDSLNIIVVYNPKWHEGVIGIVASKLVEHFKLPCVVFTASKEKDLLKASARTAGKLSILDSLAKVSDLFVKFGGHRAAAGLSMPRDKLEEFTSRINLSLKEIPPADRRVQKKTPLQIQCGGDHSPVGAAIGTDGTFWQWQSQTFFQNA